jgi:hypothetical protein
MDRVYRPSLGKRHVASICVCAANVVVCEIFALRYNVNGALIGCKLPTVRDNLSVPSSRVKDSNCLNFEGGTDRLTGKVGDLVRIDVA